MTSIGFSPASVGAMAAVYAVVVPVLEVPSGVLADRWSRRGVLILASIAAILSVLIGGLSQSVAVYMVSAGFLGVFFALQSGTLESVVYDTVLEETGGSDAFETTIGRVRLVERRARRKRISGRRDRRRRAATGHVLLDGSVARGRWGGAATVPGATVAQGRSRGVASPAAGQHLPDDPGSGPAPGRGGADRGRVRPDAGHAGVRPLWLVALAVAIPMARTGPGSSALGLGGLLGAQAWITRPWAVGPLAIAITGCCVVLALSQQALVVVGVQVGLTLLVVAVSIPVLRRLHDAVPSSIRAGVASGVGTLTWLTFVPFALVFGAVSEARRRGSGRLASGGDRSGGRVAGYRRASPGPGSGWGGRARRSSSGTEEARIPVDRFVPADDPEWPGHWAHPPAAWDALGVAVDLAPWNRRAKPSLMPPALREVIVLRDVEGRRRSRCNENSIWPRDERALLHRARGLVRARLERYLEEREQR